MTKAEVLIEAAQRLAAANPSFQEVLGPGHGDRATSSFMTDLRSEATRLLSHDFSECRLCGDTAFAVDFYIPDEATIIEVALGLPNPGSEFEKDILKALMAQELGHHVSKLIFVSRAGAKKKCGQPGRKAVIAWAASKHALSIEIHELGGEPRVRIRRPRSKQ